MTTTFRDLGVDGALCDALEAEGIVHPFPIQELTLPTALAGHDLIGQARTGTGKTLAFGLPLLQRLDASVAETQALVVVPTRELCIQVHDDLSIGARRGLTTIAVYGGTPYEEQTAALESGVHVVVGTPGRLLDHLNRRTLDLSRVRVLVLDEADEMLDMGFLPDVERLIEGCPTERHTMLFSATMPTEIVRMGRRYMAQPTFIRADTTAGETAPTVDQHFLQVHRMDKPRLLARILQTPDRGNVYVFVRTKHMADRLVEELGDLGSEAIAIHGDLRQTTREKNLERFRSGSVSVLVATEVAARGLDVENVTHVVNYDCPEDEKMYLHRIGRTARAGRAGVAVTFVEHSEVERANLIRRAIDRTDLEVRETFSTSPWLAEAFGLPEDVPWARAVARRRAPSEDGGGRGRGGGRGEGRGGRGGRDGGDGRGGRGGERGGRRGGERDDAGRGRDDASRGRDRDEAPRRREDRPDRASTAGPDDTPSDRAAGDEDATPARRRRRGGRGRRGGGAGGASGTQGTDASERSSADAGEGPARSGRDGQDGSANGAGGSGPSGGRRRRGRRGGGSGGSGGGDAGRSGERSGGSGAARTAERGGQPQSARRVRVQHLP